MGDPFWERGMVSRWHDLRAPSGRLGRDPTQCCYCAADRIQLEAVIKIEQATYGVFLQAGRRASFGPAPRYLRMACRRGDGFPP